MQIILLENQVLECEAERDKHKKASTYSKERLAEMEKDRKDLADEYVVLKTNYLALTKEHQKEVVMHTVTMLMITVMGRSSLVWCAVRAALVIQ